LRDRGAFTAFGADLGFGADFGFDTAGLAFALFFLSPAIL
jgi:hypothetical protein